MTDTGKALRTQRAVDRAGDASRPLRTGDTAGAVDPSLLLDCVHCGLCTAACPTYVELGDENDSPRGRIYLMRQLSEGRIELSAGVRRHFDRCLDCRACETACPSGVQYGRLIEPLRVALRQSDTDRGDWFEERIMLGMLPYADRLRRALRPAWIAQRLRLDRLAEATGLLRLLPGPLRQLVSMLPPLDGPLPPLPETLPAIGRRRARVALFTGCVADAMFRRTHWATARVLQENGCDILVPRDQVCCGAIHFHAGSSQPAGRMALQNVAAFDTKNIDAVIVNVAGCGSMLKEYGHHWQDSHQQARAALAEKVRDVHEFLDQLGLKPPTGPLPMAVTYHDACHLGHAQRITEAPRRLLAQIPQLELRELAEADLCCGAAGTYNLVEPEMSGRLARRKLDRILATGARTVAVANAGCILQIASQARRQGAALRVVHPMELLDESYRGGAAER